MSINKCTVCGKEFEAQRSDKLYCSFLCMAEVKFGKAVCSRCKKEFVKTGPNVKFCGYNCSEQHKWENNKPEFEYVSIRSDKEKKSRFVVVLCGVCGKETEKTAGVHRRNIRQFGQSFCSRQCASIATGKSVRLVCSECGKDFTRGMAEYKTYNENGQYVFCSKECQSKNLDYVLRGASHYCYINGESKNNRGKGWKTIRKVIRKRDNHTCQRCGITEQELGKKLDVHHIIPYRDFDDCEAANSSENLISYCPSCHHKKEHEILQANQRN